jgi:cyclophilin family peptidyl-prolyl cis-trans isomerase
MTRQLGGLALALAVAAGGSLGAAGRQTPAPPGSTLVLETARGTIVIRLFPADAPKSVAQISSLVKAGFYRGLRFHRVERTLVQVGDPTTRDFSRRDTWGRTSSGKPIGVAEFSKRRSHIRGTVSLAHPGDARAADSQFFIMKSPERSYDGKYTIIGQVAFGMDVVDRLQQADVIKLATIK